MMTRLLGPCFSRSPSLQDGKQRNRFPSSETPGGVLFVWIQLSSTRPAALPKPIRCSLPARPRWMILLPCSMKVRASRERLHRLLAALRELHHRAVRVPASRPEIVPEPSRSPGRRLQPLEVWCATSCATVQYESRKLACESRTGDCILHVFRCISTRISSPPSRWSSSSKRYDSGFGSSVARGKPGSETARALPA